MTRGARGMVVCPDIRGRTYEFDAEARRAEAVGLALAIGVNVAVSEIFTIRQVKPNVLFGSGQLDAIAVVCEQHDIELVIVDGALTPIQQRNLEDRLKRKVIDRTGLILEIFGERADTAEGRLQVELAHLDYQQSRLVRSWTHLERQRGGFGFLGGPGETQIEADRRMIRQRMGRLRRELEQVRRTRALHRERRSRAPWPVISLVGYTNAGKSTLFNRLTDADVMAEDLLFATLDPTMRAISLPGVQKAILSDTVGFISDLPTQLVAAFRATLEEVISADVICHVRDISSDTAEAQKAQVLDVLRDLDVIGAENEETVPIIEVWNKIDLLEPSAKQELVEANAGRNVCPISAETGEGVDRLLERLGELLTEQAKVYEFTLSPADGRKLAWLHEHGEVLNHTNDDGSSRVTVKLNAKEAGQFASL